MFINSFLQSIKSIVNATLNTTTNTTVNVVSNNKELAIIYIRVSTKEQEYDAQQFTCVNFCNENNLEVKKIYIEKCSGYKQNSQKELNKLINEQSNINLIVNSIDRFSRNINKADELLKQLELKNINLISVKESINLKTALGKLHFRNYVNASQYESELISERVLNSIKYRKLNNIPIGKAPYGYEYIVENNKKKMIQKADEYPIIEFISSNLYKHKSSEQMTNEFHKLLTKLKCDKKKFGKIIFTLEDDEYEFETYPTDRKIKITFKVLSDILNDFDIKKRNYNWSAKSVSTVFKNISFYELKRLRI